MFSIVLSPAITTVCAIVAATVALTILLASRSTRVALVCSPLLGIALGFLFVAPAVLSAHHLTPETIRQWWTITTWMAVAFAAIGVIVSFVPALILGGVSLALKSDSRDDAAVPVLCCAGWLPAGYLTLSSLVEWVNFSRPPATNNRAVMLWIAAACVALLCGAAIVAIQRTGRKYRLISTVAWSAIIGVIAVALLPLRMPARRTVMTVKLPPLQQVDAGETAPLLVIGLDGGDWRLLKPAIEGGRAPHLAQLVSGGIHGNVKAQWPPYWSTPAWGAILTGHDIDEIGVHEDLAATADGLPPFELPLTLDLLLNPLFVPEFLLIHRGVIEPTPVPRDRLRRAPVWERLTAAGKETAVIRLPFTYPAPGQATYVVSNRVVTDLWDQLGVEPGQPRLLFTPQSEFDRLMPYFSGPATADGGSLVRIRGAVPLPKPADSIVELEEVVTRVLDIEQRMVSATEDLVRRHPQLDVVMVHMTSLDNISHAFWQYRFPEDFDRSPHADDVRALGPVVDRYVEYIDAEIGRLIRAFPTEPNVLIVSDHGAQASHNYPMWKGWHGPQGVFMAAGPDIIPSGTPLMVSYFDIVPTILELQRFAVPADLVGRSLVHRVRSAGSGAKPVSTFNEGSYNSSVTWRRHRIGSPHDPFRRSASASFTRSMR